MEQTKLGLIGLGYIGKVHLMNCLKLQNAQLEAVADISKRALNMAKRAGVPKTYKDYHELLNDKNVNAVIIALPNHLHLSCVKDAAEAKKHILLEKPLARNVKEGEEMVFSAKKNDVKLMVGYPTRFALPFKNLRDRITSGELGEIQLAVANNMGAGPLLHRAESDAPRPVPEWWFNSELTGGGALIDLGCHMISLLRWYFGEATDAKAYLGHRYNLPHEDHAVCTIKFEQGQVAILNVGWFSQQSQAKIEVLGTMGYATSAHAPPSKVKTAIQLMLKRTPDFYLPYLAEIQHFVNSIQQNRQPNPSGEDALKDLEVIQKAYQNEIRLV